VIAAYFSRNSVFYPAIFGVWAAVILSLHGGYRYHDAPLASAGYEKKDGGVSKTSLLRNSITELEKNYGEEKDVSEKTHILQNIGCAYYDLYHEVNDRSLLDSALLFTRQSVLDGQPNARFFYNLGRIFTERGDHARALQQYDLALQQDPGHVLALSNAGTCAYFAFGKRKESAGYFGRALMVDSLLPMCHVVLGLIDLDERDSVTAIDDFEKELHADSLALVKNRYPLQQSSIYFAASISHQNLFMLYSTKAPDRAKAEQHFSRYLASEPDRAKREIAEKEMKKFWGNGR
jgi:tetratricopeptide (TPR) repeat protein